MCRVSTAYLRRWQIVFMILITASAVGFTSSISWCQSAIWMTIVSVSISFMMWGIKAPCYVPLWSPGFRCARIACNDCSIHQRVHARQLCGHVTAFMMSSSALSACVQACARRAWLGREPAHAITGSG